MTKYPAIKIVGGDPSRVSMSHEYQVFMNGADISHQVKAISVEWNIDDIPLATIQFVPGELEVEARCEERRAQPTGGKMTRTLAIASTLFFMALLVIVVVNYAVENPATSP